MRWATITATAPLRVRLDGDIDPLPFAPDSLVDPLELAVNDRVRCEVARRVVIVGRSGGIPAVRRPFTPSWTDLTVGNGTVTAAYWISGALVHASVRLVLGSTSAVGQARMALPVPSNTLSFNASVTLIDSSAGSDGRYLGALVLPNNSALGPFIEYVESNNRFRHLSLGTQPFSWDVSDEIRLEFSYLII